MTKSAAKSNLKRSAARRHAEKRSDDRAVYFSVLMLSAFILAILFFTVQDDSWMYGIVGLLIAILGMINYFTWQVVRGKGKGMAMWQRSFAKVPLRFIGYGRKGGKPIDAAHDQDSAKMALYVTAALSVVLILGAWAVVARFASM